LLFVQLLHSDAYTAQVAVAGFPGNVEVVNEQLTQVLAVEEDEELLFRAYLQLALGYEIAAFHICPLFALPGFI
jgi:hypothetical protein